LKKIIPLIKIIKIYIINSKKYCEGNIEKIFGKKSEKIFKMNINIAIIKKLKRKI